MTDLSTIRCTIAADVLDHLIKMGEPDNCADEIILEMARNNVNAAIEAASTSDLHYETEGMAHLRQTLTGLGFDNYEIQSFKSALIALERAGFVLNRKVKAS